MAEPDGRRLATVGLGHGHHRGRELLLLSQQTQCRCLAFMLVLRRLIGLVEVARHPEDELDHLITLTEFEAVFFFVGLL